MNTLATADTFPFPNAMDSLSPLLFILVFLHVFPMISLTSFRYVTELESPSECVTHYDSSLFKNALETANVDFSAIKWSVLYPGNRDNYKIRREYI